MLLNNTRRNLSGNYYPWRPVLVIVIFFFLCAGAYPQKHQRHQIIVAYVYNFAKNIEWKNEQQIKQFNFVIISDDTKLINDFYELSKSNTLKEKPIKITTDKLLTDTNNIHLVFIGRDKLGIMSNVLDNIEGKNILLVSENYEDERSIMINLFETEEKKIQFKINKSNIINQGLTVLPNMVLLGGTEVDVAQIYKESQQSLRMLKKHIDSLRQNQDILRREIRLSKQEIASKQEKISKQNKSIESHKYLLEKEKTKLKYILIDVDSKQEVLNKQKNIIEKREKEILDKKLEIDRRNEILSSQQIKLDSQKEELQKQDIRLAEQDTTISAQKKVLYLMYIIIILIVGLSITIYSGYKNKRKINIKLEDQKNKLQVALEQLTTTQGELIKSKQEAEMANKAKSTFLANMSHELRTPLNSILGFSQIIARARDLSDENLNNINIINHSGQYLLSLINQVLDISKIEAGKISILLVQTDLLKLEEEISSLFRSRIIDKGLEFNIQVKDNNPRYIMADEVKLKQVLINLLGNAIKFTNNGSINLKISSHKTSQDKDPEKYSIYFEVKDTGFGIKKEDLKIIFEAFAQPDNRVRAIEGTGLGLAISFQFVKLLGGDLMVESEFGKGSKFYFEIPASLVKEPVIEKQKKHKKVLGIAHTPMKYKVLIVDDIKDNRKMLEKLLKSIDSTDNDKKAFEIRTAINGKQAVQTFKKWKPHLILMDLRMPVMDGYEAIHNIKATGESENTKIIALTASTFREEKDKLKHTGADGFILKPFNDYELFEMLEKHLDMKFISEESISKEETFKHSKAIIKKRLPKVQRKILDDFHEALVILDVKYIATITDKISKDDPKLGEALKVLTNSFSYDIILDMLPRQDPK